jgi:signal transduction histidine kinase
MYSANIHILLIEDNPGDVVLAKEYLGATKLKITQIGEAGSIAQAIEYIQNNKPDIILADLSLPDSMGIETFYVLKDNYPAIPVIILTGLSDENMGLDAVRNGAQDYLVKGNYDEQLIEKSIVYSIERAKNYKKITESEERNRSLIEELTKYNKDLQQFSYITSHNLRAPVANLIGLLDIYDKEQPTAPLNKTVIEGLETSTQQINNTLNDLIEVVTIRKDVNMDVADLSFVMEFMLICNSIKNNITESGAKINTDFKAAPTIKYNKGYLESILQNLLTNSIKYRSPDRPLVINVKTKIENGYTVLSFSDNGLGIDLAHNKDRIFGLYQRFHSNKDSKGLGLYIVNTQVRTLGGRIEVESEPDKGATFNVYFKLITG